MEMDLTPIADERLLCVKVGKIARENIYEMTRKYWKLDGCKAAEADYVLAVIDGIVDSVFEPDEWFKTEAPHTGRWSSSEASQRTLYRKKRESFGRSANPVRYINSKDMTLSEAILAAIRSGHIPSSYYR